MGEGATIDRMTKVLVAEDDQLLSTLLVNHLQKEGLDTKAVYDGGAAVQTVKEWRPDVLLLDIMMPVKSGWDVMKEVKADPSTSASMSIIIISNLEADDAVSKAKALGANDYLVKAAASLGQITERVKQAPKGPTFEGVTYET